MGVKTVLKKNSEKKLFNYVISKLKKIHDVKAIILFGSYSRGEQKPISDIDLCIITKRNASNRVKENIVSHSSQKIDISLFWDLPSTIRYSVLRNGKILFKRDAKLLHSSIIDTMSEYLDFQHIIRKNIARMIA
ncbi:nucleotidyltransferase domain-containing protein [Candidatus Woesearchaeota archaeon]|nr:nucleotidyltransferase domain-containing protein [Candidatus Woesearchaeota archaeon]